MLYNVSARVQVFIENYEVEADSKAKAISAVRGEIMDNLCNMPCYTEYNFSKEDAYEVE